MAKKVRDINWLVNEYIFFFQKFGIDEQSIRNRYNNWKDGKEVVFINDFLWYMFQKILLDVAEQCESEEQLYSLNIDLYSKMWEFLVYVENKNPNHIKKVMHENELRLWQLRSKYKTEVEIISGHCCTFCDNLHGKHITFEEALEKQYLASNQCTREAGCNCCYATIAVRDKNNRLIPISH